MNAQQTVGLRVCEPTWFPSYRSFLSAAEAHFAEDAEDVSVTERLLLFSRTRASLVGGDLVAVGLASLTLLSDQGAGDGRRHLPERRTEPPRKKSPAPALFSESEDAVLVQNRGHV